MERCGDDRFEFVFAVFLGRFFKNPISKLVSVEIHGFFHSVRRPHRLLARDQPAFYNIFFASSRFRNGPRSFCKKFSRVPIFLLFSAGSFVLSSGNWKKGIAERLAFFLVMFSVFSAGYLLYWSSYENVSRMFTVSTAFLIFWKLEDDSISDSTYWIVTGSILFFFLLKLTLISSTLPYEIWK